MNNQMLQLADLVAEKAAQKVINYLEGKKESKGEYVDINEAAQLLGYSVTYMRQIKKRFPHVKVGPKKQGRLMFSRAALENYYIQNSEV